MNPLLKSLYYLVFPSWINHLKRELSDCITVLDLGCGYNSAIQYCIVPFSVGVELFEPYLKESRKKEIHNQYVKADLKSVEFSQKSFDAVIAIEVLEHLSKDEGIALLVKMHRWSKKKLIITTPNGYFPQDYYDNNLLQQHKSGWTIKELKEFDFTVFGINGWKRLRGDKGLIKYRPVLIFRMISDLSQKITYRYPQLAFQLLAVKNLKDTK